MVVTNDEIKNKAGQDLTYNSKNSKKPFLKNQIKKPENQCGNAACEQKTTCEKWKFGSNKKLGLE